MIRIVAMIALALASLACETKQEEAVPAYIDSLIGNWQLVEPSSPYVVTLRIGERNERGFALSGSAPVNTYSGSVADPGLIFTSEKNPFQVRELTNTEIAGPADAMQFEQSYFVNLRAAYRYELTNQNRLRLYYRGAPDGVYVYERK